MAANWAKTVVDSMVVKNSNTVTTGRHAMRSILRSLDLFLDVYIDRCYEAMVISNSLMFV